MININDIVNVLFAELPFSKQSEDAKLKIERALNAEYKKELKESNSVRAIGILMSRYSTIEDAGKLAGYNDEEISKWTCTENITDMPAFKKQFRKVRWNVYIGTYFSILTFFALLDIFIYSSWLYLIAAVVFAAPAALCFRKLNKTKSVFNYQSPRLNSEAYEYLKQLSDKYSKRLFNSAFIGIALVFYIIFFISISAITTKMKNGEIIQYSFSMISSYDIIAYLIIKNLLCKKWIDNCFDSNRKKLYNKHKRRLITATVGYWLAITLTLILFRSKITFYFNVFYAAMILYAVLLLVYNLTIRKAVVCKNIVVNKKRIAAFGTAFVVFAAYNVMQMDSWLIQPYISTISAVEYADDNISYNDETGVYTITTDKQDFKILQLTDIHLGGSAVSTYKDYKALNAVYDLISYAKPDLVIVTGDLVFPMGVMSLSLNNYTPIMQFSSFMRNIGIPWAFLYGNHDTENMAKSSADEVDELFKSLSYETTHNLLYPYIQPDITGRNNQLIEIRNSDGSLNQALFLLDSNDYTGNGINDYDYIHDDEVDWYESKIHELNNNEGKNISSMVFFHMPLQEYRTAYELYEYGSDEIKYFFGENGETMINKVCCSSYPSKLFDTALKSGSTKAMFCGHDHYNNLSVEYKGIRLTYGMSIDYLAMPGIDEDTAQRGGTLITLYPDSEFDIEQIRLSDITVNSIF